MSYDEHLRSAIRAEGDHLFVLAVRQDAALSLAASAPRIVGQLRSAVEADNWWAVAGWSLRALDTVLLEIGHLRHDAYQRQAAIEFWRRANEAAREAVPDEDSRSERVKVIGRWAREAPGRAARRGTLLGAGIYTLGRGVLRIHRRRALRALPATRSVLPVPSRARRLYYTARASFDDLVRNLHPSLPDHRGD